VKIISQILVHADGLLSSEITQANNEEVPGMVHLYLADPQYYAEDDSTGVVA
jgi:hypothetical protein